MTLLAVPSSNYHSTNTSQMTLEHNSLHTDEVVAYMLSPTSILNDSHDNKTTDELVNTSNNKMKPSLHFNDTTSIQWIENTDDMSNEEIDACYYNSRDYSCFRDRERRLSRNCSNWSFFKGGRKRDLLGVETPLQRFHRRERSRNAVYAVILEQELRQEHNQDSDSLSEEDALGIANVYQQYTKESERLARERALVNLSQVDRTESFPLFSNSDALHKIDMGKWGEREPVAARQYDPPWEVPFSNKNSTANIRPSAMIKYMTCSRPLLPGHHIDMLHCKEHDMSRKQLHQFRDFRYEDQFNLQDRDRSNENRRQRAPVQQKIVRAQNATKFSQVLCHTHDRLQPLRQHVVHEGKHRETGTQTWMWDSIPCDSISPSNYPRTLSWNAY